MSERRRFLVLIAIMVVVAMITTAAAIRILYMVEYCVEDNGIGIAPENYDRVFQLFHRLDPSVTTGEGVGLTLIKKIVDRHGGQVRLESKPGEGSRFYLSLPVKAGGER